MANQPCSQSLSSSRPCCSRWQEDEEPGEQICWLHQNNLQLSEDIFESWALTGSLCSCSCMISTSDNDLESSLVSTVTCCFQWKVTNTHQENENQLSGPSPYCEKHSNTSKRTSWPSWSSKRFDVVKTHIKPHLITSPPLPRLVFALRPVEAASSCLFLLFVSEVNILKKHWN